MLLTMPLMDLPDPAHLPQSTLDLASRLANIFSSIDPTDAMNRVETWLKKHPVARDDPSPLLKEALIHPLSSFIVAAVTEIAPQERTPTEIETLQHGPIPQLEPGKPCGIEQLEAYMLAIHDHLCPWAKGYRTGQVQSRIDARSTAIQYPHPSNITERMRSICQYWCQHHKAQPGLAATLMMISLMNLHPFSDGNGRTARIMFHWALNTNDRGIFYLPLHEISTLSRCGYLIRLRQAQYHGNFDPILSFLILCANGFALHE